MEHLHKQDAGGQVVAVHTVKGEDAGGAAESRQKEQEVLGSGGQTGNDESAEDQEADGGSKEDDMRCT